MRSTIFRTMVAAAMALTVAMGMVGCGGLGVAYENDECRMTDVVLDRSEVCAQVTATFENKTSSREKFSALVILLDDAGEEIGEALVFSEEAEGGETVPSSIGLISTDDGFADADDAALDRVAELKVESVISQTAMGEYLSSSEASATDPLVGYWKCLRTNLEGETHDVSGSNAVYAQFRDDGTWTFTVGDETYDNVWMTSDQIDGVPYALMFADDVWGGMIAEEDAADMLVLGSLTDTDNTMVFQRAE